MVENVRQAALDLPPAFDVYIPLRQIHPDGVALLRNNQFWMVKTDSDPAAFRATFLTHLRAVDPDAAVSGTGTMRQYLDAWLGPRRFNLGLFGAFALTAVAAGGVGSLRTRRVCRQSARAGDRPAHGDRRHPARRAAHDPAPGGGAWRRRSSAGSGARRRRAAAHLRHGQDVSISPGVVAATAALLIAVVLLAAWVPARRAARIEPTLALKGQ